MPRFDPVVLNQTKRGKDGFYRFPDAAYRSTTTQLSVVNKPALIHWAAKTERVAALEAAAALYKDCDQLKEPITHAAFIEAATKRMGAVKAHEKKLKEAADIGTAIHAWIEAYLLEMLDLPGKPLPAMEPAVANGVAAFQSWLLQYELNPALIEQTVRYDPLRVAGSIDVIGTVTIDGKRVEAVIDWKSGSGIYFEHIVQNATYLKAAKWCGLVGEDAIGMIVKTPKVATDTPGVVIIDAQQQEKYLQAMQAAITIFEAQVSFGEEFNQK